MKKTLALFLSLILTLCAVSCSQPASDEPGEAGGQPAGGNAAEEAEPAEAPETDPPVTDDIPDTDFGGADFVILTSSTQTQHSITAYNEQTGDVLNDAMFDRTQLVAQKYNIHFLDDFVPGASDAALNAFTNSVKAGDGDFDLAMLLERRAFNMTGEGYFADQRELKYVNPEKPYWFRDVNNAINFTDHMFISYGATQICLYDMTHVLLFNQNMLANLGLENPYDLVFAGTWTFDRLFDMMETARQDADGDGEWGDGDVYGIMGATNALPDNFLASARRRTIDRAEDGTVQVMLLDDPMIEEIFVRITNTLWESGMWYTKTTDSNSYWRTETFFQDNQALFADHTFYSTITLRDMVSDFGIIPFPKYTADQERYGVLVEAGTRAMTVPVTAKNPDLCGAVLETLHWLSWRDVMPAYYEVTLKQKVSRDNVSAQMLDLIMDSIYYDLGMTMFCEQVKDGIFTGLFGSNNTNYVSKVTSSMKVLQKTIDKALGNRSRRKGDSDENHEIRSARQTAGSLYLRGRRKSTEYGGLGGEKARAVRPRDRAAVRRHASGTGISRNRSPLRAERGRTDEYLARTDRDEGDTRRVDDLRPQARRRGTVARCDRRGPLLRMHAGSADCCAVPREGDHARDLQPGRDRAGHARARAGREPLRDVSRPLLQRAVRLGVGI
ncbi:MAG: hypothetical protein IKX19_01800, partial [Clostridia bacterium]|nr:hypothetical protein [Clostridia bacterium]